MYGLISGRLLKKLVRDQERSPVDAPTTETENLSDRLEGGRYAKSKHREAEQPEELEESSTDEGEKHNASSEEPTNPVIE